MNKLHALLPAALAVLAAALPAAADPELWLLGDDDDRLAVVAVRPGDEALFAAGPLQECAAMDIPALVFRPASPSQSPDDAAAAAAALALPPDSLDLLENPLGQLPALLPAFDPSHVVLSRPDPDYLAMLAGAFPDPARRPAVLLPADGPDGADWLLSLAPFQLEAKNKALAVCGLPPAPGTAEFFAEVELDDLEDLAPRPPPAAEPPPAADAPPVRAVLPPAVSDSAPAPAPEPPVASSPSPLRPRTRLPAAPPPKKVYSSWADEPVVW